jgi:hypothetical protein
MQSGEGRLVMWYIRDAKNFRLKTPCKNSTDKKVISLDEQQRREWRAKVNRGKQRPRWGSTGHLYNWTLESLRDGVPLPKDQRAELNVKEQLEIIKKAA